MNTSGREPALSLHLQDAVPGFANRAEAPKGGGFTCQSGRFPDTPS
jgi:hypothetical protein